MKIYQIRYFYTLARELNFSVAAEKLHIAQPPLSRAIKELEKTLDTKLLIRNTRHVELTQAGKVFNSHALRILLALDSAKKATIAAAHGQHREIRIALADMIDTTRLSMLLSATREEEPLAYIQLFEVTQSDIKSGLQEDIFDIGFTQSKIKEEGIYCHKIWSEPFAVLLPKNHPLLVYDKVPLHEVIKYPQIVLDKNRFQGNHAQVKNCLISTGIMPTFAETASAIGTMLALVRAGFGVSLVSMETCTLLNKETIAYRQIEHADKVMSTYICFTEPSPLSSTSKFINRISLFARKMPFNHI